MAHDAELLINAGLLWDQASLASLFCACQLFLKIALGIQFVVFITAMH